MSLGKIVIGTNGSSLEQFIENKKKNGFWRKLEAQRTYIILSKKFLNLEEKEKRKNF